MAAIDYEHEYNTRAWAPGFEAAFARREADAAAYREQAQREGRTELGVRYGTSERQFVDLFAPAQPAEGQPLTAFIHGGFWRAQTPTAYSNLARGLNTHGVTVAMIGYDLCPQVTLSTIIDQIRAGCLFLWHRYGRRMLVIGHSAGGHLTACTVATDWKALAPDAPADLVPAGYAISGVFDVEPVVGTSVNADLRLDAAEARRLSPILWPVAPGRILDVVVGGAESPEFLRQSRAIAESWRRSEAQTRDEAVPGANHFTVIEPLADPDSAMVRRLVELARYVSTMT
ncbi:MAG: alpha/beta hydrolase fold domain-containing protein [Rhizobiales bacterium]|nr:alpha/beta hydrolase fold domain-containing protein [Hyphomicrobiales bacterium]